MAPTPTATHRGGLQPTHYLAVDGDRQLALDGYVPEEALTCLSVNGREVATWMCSPFLLEEMGLGFLMNEGLITALDEVHHVRLSKSDSCIDVWLKDQTFEPPPRAIVTAGCGGGITFDDLSNAHPPLTSDASASTAELADLMRQMQLGAERYQAARGIHTAALAHNGRIALQVEDIGRHNCLDKLRGLALKQGVATEGGILLSSGRISSEMINKARQMATPIVCSRTSPTSLSIALAETWGMTLVAYLRQNRMRVYTHPERLAELL